MPSAEQSPEKAHTRLLGGARPAPTLTKIVATVGPASESPDLVRRLIEAGVAVFRLNFSHGSFESHAERLRVIRAAAAELGQPVGVLGDLQGPKIRVGVIAGDGVSLETGSDVVFVAEGADARASGADGAARASVLPTSYPALARDVAPGQRVLINDGTVRLLAVEREARDPEGSLRCRVTFGGIVTSKKGINLPDSAVSAPAISEKDWACVHWAVANGLDFLALSFVRRAEEVRELKRALAGMCAVEQSIEGGREPQHPRAGPAPAAGGSGDPGAADGRVSQGAMIPVIAKIEKPQALEDLDAILEVADGIMVARGDLGVEMDIAEVPLVQKRLIAKADEWGKPCIVATQMLESMVAAASPTRAEATDVAGAVLDGADAVMLSAETATGKHPTLVVETMRRIAAAAERHVIASAERPSPSGRLRASRYRTAALAHGAWHVARDLGAALIACWSQEGGTARYLSQTGLTIPAVAYSNDPRQVRRMGLLRGVVGRWMEVPGGGTLREWNAAVETDLLSLGWVKPGDPIVLLAGKPLGAKAATNTLAVHYIGNRVTGYLGQG